MTKLFVEQPLASPGSAKNSLILKIQPIIQKVQPNFSVCMVNKGLEVILSTALNLKKKYGRS